MNDDKQHAVWHESIEKYGEIVQQWRQQHEQRQDKRVV